MESADKTAQPDLSAALDRLWVRFLPEISERVSVIESAVRMLDVAPLTDEQKQAAGSAAHKLAGVLGTFGLHRGTELARELELALSASPDNPPRLAALTAELRTIIESRG
jgi:HPt (histidine-containing phosphotransfer) domain-containing protein